LEAVETQSIGVVSCCIAVEPPPGVKLPVSPGFYLDSKLTPSTRIQTPDLKHVDDHQPINQLFLGPFCGKPACQYIDTTPGKARGVCAAAFLQQQTVVVPDVATFPGHIACDGETKSEIVCPLIMYQGSIKFVIGVLDLDCLAKAGFGEEDRVGLERIVRLIVKACDW
jgi:L-methionine (R)-S-oxide reductase